MAIKSKRVKMSAHQRQKFRIRAKASGTPACLRVSVFKSSKHTYVQAIDDLSGKTVASASTREAEVLGEIDKVLAAGSSAEGAPKSTHKSTKSVNAARAVGIVLARRVRDRNVEKVVFDRNGFIYCGRIQAVADGARQGGLKF